MAYTGLVLDNIKFWWDGLSLKSQQPPRILAEFWLLLPRSCLHLPAGSIRFYTSNVHNQLFPAFTFSPNDSLFLLKTFCYISVFKADFFCFFQNLLQLNRRWKKCIAQNVFTILPPKTLPRTQNQNEAFQFYPSLPILLDLFRKLQFPGNHQKLGKKKKRGNGKLQT